eukprot:XP_020393741.1 proteoglycan 4-like [Zea mays]
MKGNMGHGIISRKHLKEMSIMLHVKEAESSIMLSVKFKERRCPRDEERAMVAARHEEQAILVECKAGSPPPCGKRKDRAKSPEGSARALSVRLPCAPSRPHAIVTKAATPLTARRQSTIVPQTLLPPRDYPALLFECLKDKRPHVAAPMRSTATRVSLQHHLRRVADVVLHLNMMNKDRQDPARKRRAVIRLPDPRREAKRARGSAKAAAPGGSQPTPTAKPAVHGSSKVSESTKVVVAGGTKPTPGEVAKAADFTDHVASGALTTDVAAKVERLQVQHADAVREKSAAESKNCMLAEKMERAEDVEDFGGLVGAPPEATEVKPRPNIVVLGPARFNRASLVSPNAAAPRSPSPRRATARRPPVPAPTRHAAAPRAKGARRCPRRRCHPARRCPRPPAGARAAGPRAAGATPPPRALREPAPPSPRSPRPCTPPRPTPAPARRAPTPTRCAPRPCTPAEPHARPAEPHAAARTPVVRGTPPVPRRAVVPPEARCTASRRPPCAVPPPTRPPAPSRRSPSCVVARLDSPAFAPSGKYNCRGSEVINLY